jgi:aryl-alcohol dehydrogenase-like predicted oxidoreductase
VSGAPAVSRLSLGTASWGTAYGVAAPVCPPSDRELDRLLRQAAERGIHAIDTAPAYGDAEQRIGRALGRAALRSEFEITSKLPPLAPSSPLDIENLVTGSIHGSLRHLGADVIDVYLVHDVRDLRRHGRALIDALCRERNRGTVRRIGISVYEPGETTLAARYPELEVVQHPYSVLDQRLVREGTLRRLKGAGIAVQARSVLLQGALMLKPAELPDRIAHLAALLAELESALRPAAVTAADIAVPFVLAAEVDRLVIGVNDAGQLRRAQASATTPVSEELLAALRGLFRDVPAEAVDPRAW